MELRWSNSGGGGGGEGGESKCLSWLSILHTAKAQKWLRCIPHSFGSFGLGFLKTSVPRRLVKITEVVGRISNSSPPVKVSGC